MYFHTVIKSFFLGGGVTNRTPSPVIRIAQELKRRLFSPHMFYFVLFPNHSPVNISKISKQLILCIVLLEKLGHGL